MLQLLKPVHPTVHALQPEKPPQGDAHAPQLESTSPLATTKGKPMKQQRLNSKESACDAEAAGDVGLIPGLGRFPGGGNGNPFQYSCLENPRQRSLAGYGLRGHRDLDTTEETWHACILTVHGLK